MSTQAFLNSKTVFDLRDFDDFCGREHHAKPSSCRQLLKYYLGTGRVRHVRKALYLSTPPGRPVIADPYLICAKMALDAVLAYHTALQFHGKVYSLRNDYICLSHSRPQPFDYVGQTFKSVLFPQALVEAKEEMYGVNVEDAGGEDVRVTGLERTMVDVLQRPDLGGGWEEIWRSLEMVEYFDLNTVCNYAELLGNSTTAAKVGFFLEQHKEQLMVDDGCLERLARLRPKSPHYLDRSEDGGNTLLSTWNLVVPDSILNRSWEEQ